MRLWLLPCPAAEAAAEPGSCPAPAGPAPRGASQNCPPALLHRGRAKSYREQPRSGSWSPSMHSTAREWSQGPRAGHAGAKLSLCRVPGDPGHSSVCHMRPSLPAGTIPTVLASRLYRVPQTAPGAAACHSRRGPSHHSQDRGIPEHQGLETQSYKSRLKLPQSSEGLETLSALDLTKALLFFRTVSQSPALWQVMSLADIEPRLFSALSVLRCLNDLWFQPGYCFEVFKWSVVSASQGEQTWGFQP